MLSYRLKLSVLFIAEISMRLILNNFEFMYLKLLTDPKIINKNKRVNLNKFIRLKYLEKNIKLKKINKKLFLKNE